jgi:hypothetical protein
MAKYDLTSALENEFTFAINDKEFNFRKPTVREMREVAKVFSKIDKEKNPDKQIDMSDEAMGELYKFITPVGHSENIADVLADQNIDVQNAFNEMIKKELGANQ